MATASALSDDAEQNGDARNIAIGARSARCCLRCGMKRAQRNAERAGDDAQRFDHAQDARRGDGADADEAHIIAVDLRRPSSAQTGMVPG